MTEPTYIVAYNYRAYCSWCKDQNISPRLGYTTVYVTTRKLRGIPSGIKVRFVGEWTDRADADKILERLADLGAVNVDTGDTVEQMVAAIVEAIRRAGLSVAEAVRTTQAVRERAQARLETFRNTMPVTLPRPGSTEPPERVPVPPARTGESPVYLLDGPRAHEIINLPDAYDVLMVPAPYEPLELFQLIPGPPPEPAPRDTVVYRITTVVSCALIQRLGMHGFVPGVCDVSIRIGFSGSTDTYAEMLDRSTRTILNSLVPEWGTAARWVSAAGVWNDGAYRTYTNYREDAARRYWWQSGPASRPPAAPTPTRTSPQDVLRPVQANERDWPRPDSSVDYGMTCAHICGGDHTCEARASTYFSYRIPTGGSRSMPVCRTCHDAETAAIAAEAGK